jgi:predicted ATPase
MSVAPELNGQVAETVNTSKPPFLRRVQIEGFKSIVFCDVSLEPLTILVGRNAVGKSNFLNALAFLRDVVASGVAKAVAAHKGRKAILSRGTKRNTISIRIETNLVHPIDSTAYRSDYAIRLKIPARGEAVVTSETVRIQNVRDGTTVGFDRRDEHVEWVGFEKGNPILLDWCPPDRLFLSMYGNPPFILLSIALHDLGVHNFSPDAIRELQPVASSYRLERHGQNLPSVINAIRKDDPSTIRRIGSYLRAIVEGVDSFKAVRYGEYETIRFLMRLTPGFKPVALDAAAMSDGTLRVLATLTAAFQSQLASEGSVVGLEEPETALHPAAMRALVAALDEATLRTQILLTTHSPDLLDAPPVRPANVRVVQMIDGQTVIGPVDEASRQILAQELSTLGGLERENQLIPDLDDQDRQRHLAQTGRGPAA